MNTVWVFPGHGSQYVGMGHALLRDTAEGRGWLTHAESVSGLPLTNYAACGPTTELAKPTVLEPLLAAVSCAYVDWLVAGGNKPVAVGGYSAGEVAAMYAAGVFDAETCLRIACIRGQALESAAAMQPGGMLALSGLPVADLVKLVVKIGKSESIGVAAYNGPRHLTVAGTYEALKRVAVHARTCGAEVGIIDAAGPWHTNLVAVAQQQISRATAVLHFVTPRVPVWLGSSGASCTDSKALRRSVAESVAMPVRWHEVIGGLLAAGYKDFLEVGPGRTLFGLLGQLPLPPQVTRGFLERLGLRRLPTPTRPIRVLTTQS